MNRWNSDRLRKSMQIAVCTVGVLAMTFTALSQDYGTAPPSIMEYADCIDDFGGVTIGEEGVPLAEAPRVTTKTTTKKTTKKEKMKKASKVSKTSRKKNTRKEKKTEKRSDATVTTVTTTATTTATSVKKKSKIKTIKTTVKTTIKTTTVPKAKGGAGKEATVTTNTKATAAAADVSFRGLAKGADERILSAFESLGFEMTITPTAPYSGVFSAREQKIDIRSANSSHLLHELGHFLSFVGGGKDGTEEFKKIFADEKGSYKEINASYVLRNSSEYFAESFKNYTEDGAKLKKDRPQTYAYIEASLAGVNAASVQQIKNLYAPFWK